MDILELWLVYNHYALVPILLTVFPKGQSWVCHCFSINMLLLGQLITKHNVQYHCYAGDTQLYVTLPSDLQPSATNCQSLRDQNFLKLPPPAPIID